MISQITKSLQYVWLTLSLAALLVLGAPFLLSADSLLSAAGGLSSPHPAGQACSLCGMTRAFLAISQGDFHQARQWNRGSIPLYGLMAALPAATAIFLILQWFKRSRSSLALSPRIGLFFLSFVICHLSLISCPSSAPSKAPPIAQSALPLTTSSIKEIASCNYSV